MCLQVACILLLSAYKWLQIEQTLLGVTRFIPQYLEAFWHMYKITIIAIEIDHKNLIHVYITALINALTLLVDTGKGRSAHS